MDFSSSKKDNASEIIFMLALCWLRFRVSGHSRIWISVKNLSEVSGFVASVKLKTGEERGSD
jgi:hypothetical protein